MLMMSEVNEKSFLNNAKCHLFNKILYYPLYAHKPSNVLSEYMKSRWHIDIAMTVGYDMNTGFKNKIGVW